jgi:hypothetical protein
MGGRERERAREGERERARARESEREQERERGGREGGREGERETHTHLSLSRRRWFHRRNLHPDRTDRPTQYTTSSFGQLRWFTQLSLPLHSSLPLFARYFRPPDTCWACRGNPTNYFVFSISHVPSCPACHPLPAPPPHNCDACSGRHTDCLAGLCVNAVFLLFSYPGQVNQKT